MRKKSEEKEITEIDWAEKIEIKTQEKKAKEKAKGKKKER